MGKHLEDHLLAGGGVRVTAITRQLVDAEHARVDGAARDRPAAVRSAAAPVEAGAFVRSHPDAPLPDIQFHVTPWGVNLPTDDEAKPPFGRFALDPARADLSA